MWRREELRSSMNIPCDQDDWGPNWKALLSSNIATLISLNQMTISGEGAQCGFPLSHFEAEVLVTFWTDLKLRLLLITTVRGDATKEEMDAVDIAVSRLVRLEELLGVNAITTVYDRINADYRRRLGDEVWRVLTVGTEEERHRIRADVEE